MQKCPKCSQQFESQAKICRRCGAILDAVADAAPPSTPCDAGVPPAQCCRDGCATEFQGDSPPNASPATSWPCPNCGQSVPNTFDVCWNCGTGRDGTPDPDFLKDPPEDTPGETEEESAAENSPTVSPAPCPKCGSTKIIPEIPIRDQGHYSDGFLQVVVEGNPRALIFKDCFYGRLAADICGDCGHVELRVDHPQELYEHYRQTAE
jgi:hypothetical protein